MKHALLTYHWPAYLHDFKNFYERFSIWKTFNVIKLSEIHGQKALLKNYVVLSAT